MVGEKKKIYVACSLTHATEDFKKEIAEFRERLREKYEILDFVGLENGTEEDVFNHDMWCVKTADLLLVDCSQPALGAGWEMGVAFQLGKPMILIANQDAKVTRLVLGAVSQPNIIFKRYNRIDETIDLVDEKMANI